MAWITIKDHRYFLFVQRIGDARLKLKMNDLVCYPLQGDKMPAGSVSGYMYNIY